MKNVDYMESYFIVKKIKIEDGFLHIDLWNYLIFLIIVKFARLLRFSILPAFPNTLLYLRTTGLLHSNTEFRGLIFNC